MLRRLYVHNFRCLENFDLPASGHSSVLLIGNNGSGKTTVGRALEILQRIARGTNRVGQLVQKKDLTGGCEGSPMRFEIAADLPTGHFEYAIALEFPKGFKEFRVLEERLVVDQSAIYTRTEADVNLRRTSALRESTFRIDWHLAALPVVQAQEGDPLFTFRQWLARMLILRPIPSLITGDSAEETLEPDSLVTNFGDWFSGLLASAPAAYSRMDKYLKQVMPDLRDIKNPSVAKGARRLEIHFDSQDQSLTLPFDDLSDGEKCFMICALVLAANHSYGPLLCFWDEPDNYLALSEVGHFLMVLRRAFLSDGGQFIATSHNPEAISRFAGENTLVLSRNSHLEPTTVRQLSEIEVSGDLISALVRGGLDR